MRPMASDREVLTVREVGDPLRVHPYTVYKLIREGKIPSFRTRDGDWRFRRDVILRWITEKSIRVREVRKVIESGVNGVVRHRSLAGSRGPKR
jgi:excisionase family DNA binding protein